MLLELNEVEAGMYETTPSHTHYFLQTLAAINKERITDDLFGDWQFTRGTARVICQMTLGNTAHDTDSFVLTLKPGCDPLITRFAPVSWRLRSRPVRDARRQRPVLALRGERERIWSRIPAVRPPLHDDAAAEVVERNRSAVLSACRRQPSRNSQSVRRGAKRANAPIEMRRRA